MTQGNGNGSPNGGGGGDGPITGENFADWVDRLQNLEEILEDPEMRGRVAQAREQATAMRSEFRRHGSRPQWPLVQSQIQKPLIEVQQWVQEQLNQKKNPDRLAPIDRDQVPRQYSDLVRRYYERLSSGK